MKHSVFNAPAARRIRMRLLNPHTHAGEPKDIGDEIDVDVTTADWLAANRVATALTTTPARIAQRRGNPGDDDHEQ